MACSTRSGVLSKILDVIFGPLTAVTRLSTNLLVYDQRRNKVFQRSAMTPLLRSWYRVDFPLRECCRDGKPDHLQKAFEVMYVTSHKPLGAALFERHDDNCETNSFYFSPEAATLISLLLEFLGAIVCEPPRLTERLVLLVGDEDVQTNLRYRQTTFRGRSIK